MADLSLVDAPSATPQFLACPPCASVWQPTGTDSADTACSTCGRPGRRDTVGAALCTPCQVTWHPGVLGSCWSCGGSGTFAPQSRAWEALPATAHARYTGLFATA